jgi:hypothetical protein
MTFALFPICLSAPRPLEGLSGSIDEDHNWDTRVTVSDRH